MAWARDLFGEIRVVESRTAEPTRVVIGEGPSLGNGPLAERCRDLPRTIITAPWHKLIRGAYSSEIPLICFINDSQCGECGFALILSRYAAEGVPDVCIAYNFPARRETLVMMLE
jgi:hypothetical protein